MCTGCNKISLYSAVDSHFSELMLFPHTLLNSLEIDGGVKCMCTYLLLNMEMHFSILVFKIIFNQ